MLFSVPELDIQELDVCLELDEMRAALRGRLSEPRDWAGMLLRASAARAIRGSIGIEGYAVDLDDATAAVAGAEALGASGESRAAVGCYRDALAFVRQLADDPTFKFEASLIKALHFQMMSFDLAKSPGRWRSNDAYVRDERSGEILYRGPDPRAVPKLVDELLEELRSPDAACPDLVRAAMAHLDLVMIHPFRDGNGRMARGLQTLVLAREGDLPQEYISVEEYIGRNTETYYAVLASAGGGSWDPDRDARPWIRFNLTAHYSQIRTMLRRTGEADRRWSALAFEARRLGLPERTVGALWDAALGLRVRNQTYRVFAEVSRVVAGRDLRALAAAGLLDARGNARGRCYAAADRLLQIESGIQGRPVEPSDPFAAPARRSAFS